MPSIVTVTGHWKNERTGELVEICALDSRYGVETRGNYGRKTAEEMARLDNLIESAGIKPGDSIEILLKRQVPNYELRRMEEKETWVRLSDLVGDAIFCAIDNGRFRVQGAPGTRDENRSWAYQGETTWIIGVRRETPTE